jgi:hypothetical protein
VSGNLRFSSVRNLEMPRSGWSYRWFMLTEMHLSCWIHLSLDLASDWTIDLSLKNRSLKFGYVNFIHTSTQEALFE